MQRVAVESSNIVSVGYEEAAELLEVEFKGGRVYQYFGVPPSVHADMMSAPSMGKFFGGNIRNEYSFEQVE